ncbi:flagellar motor protein MotB [Dokdonia sinensis]|uniref:Flagellar motor protein MotB n=1 Tax=Dokdonia sinensis TaxID=2479847 RepID=A0A3M0G275_9FLAO|nr:OmpA family protein [Dokdonia sinensis]RMB59061.1 flagellar motor protein MotB [Dokdonia sinensis]
MKIITFKITLILIFLVGSTALGQEGKLKRADKKFNQYAFVDARKIYLEIADEGYSSAELFEKLGDSYYFNAQYEDAERWYQKLVSNYEAEIRPEYLFRYSQTLRALKNYDAADRMMNKFNAVNGDDLRAELFEEEPNYIRNIGYQESNYTLEDVRAINSRYSDFAPTEYEGKLIFASSRDTGGASKRIHKWNNQPFLDLYSTRVSEESYSRPSRFSKELNSKFHESTTTFTNDSKTVYFTRNNYNEGNYRKSESGTNKLKIYKSTKKGSTWSTPVEMPFNSNEYSTAHPTLSPDNTKLYFASDMPGTIGQSDIWFVDINEDGTYGEPKNLGRPLNTEGRETFPFKSLNNDLYFASDGHPGLGGLDIYVLGTKKDGSPDIINLGEPINSSYDDFSFIVNDSTQVGYLASNRKRGMGSDDIYRFVQEIIPPCEMVITGVVTDSDSGELLPGATVLLMDEDNVLVEKVTVADDAIFSFDVACETSYVVRGSKEKYNPAEKSAVTPAKSGKVTVGIALEKVIRKAAVGDDLFQTLGLNPIYFDFDRFNIRPDAAFEISKVLAYLNEYPTSKIDIRSHTDSRGNDAYNESLSDKRAKSTMAWLISKGVDRSRLTAKGYGESQLVNECSNGVKCTEEEHQLNRRSEFIVISQ